MRPWLRLSGALVAALAIVSGHVVDRTTGQPLPGVTLRLDGADKLAATSDAGGAFTLRGLTPGKHVVTLESDDVPPQHVEVNVGKAPAQHADLAACSTTLDYSCAGVQ